MSSRILLKRYALVFCRTPAGFVDRICAPAARARTARKADSSPFDSRDMRIRLRRYTEMNGDQSKYSTGPRLQRLSAAEPFAGASAPAGGSRMSRRDAVHRDPPGV